MRKSKTFLMAGLLLLFSCGGNNENSNEQHDKSPQMEDSSQPKTTDDEMLSGNVSITLGEENFNLTELRKRGSEITWMNDNKISVRIISLDKEKSIYLILSGPDIYNKSPLDVSLKAGDFEETNHGAITLKGFLGSEDKISSTHVMEGKGSIKELDQQTLDFSMSFEGKAVHLIIGSKNDTLKVSGEIDIQFDNAVETRQNQ